MDQTVKELHKKRMKLWKASISNHQGYIDTSTGLFKQEFIENRNCPVCSSKDYFHMFDKEGGSYVKCKDCNMVYLNPVFSDTTLEKYYIQNHSVQAQIVEGGDPFYQGLYNMGIDSIELQTERGAILDVGCSSGAFLDTAKTRGWQTYGIELNRKEFAMAEKRGHSIYNTALEKSHFDIFFNAVTLWDVFEHIKDGIAFLKRIKPLLSENGVVFLQIPSADALAAKILREKCNMFDGLEHVNLYGVETIQAVAERCGMEIREMRSVISEIGVINNYLNYEDPYLGNTDNKIQIPGLIDEKGLHRNLMGYKLQVVIGGMTK